MAKTKKIIPVKRGEKIELVIENLASSGDGICRHDGYTLFLPNCVPGDKIIAEVTKITPRFGVCKIAKVLSHSSGRVEPVCPLFYKCGGCQLQYLPYEKQADFKVQVVKDAIEKIGKLNLTTDPLLIPADHPLHYRNKGIFPLEQKEKILIGFYARNSHRLIDVESCPVMLDPINRIYEKVRIIFEKYKPSIYNEATHKGFIRNLILRGSLEDKEFMVGLVTTSGDVNKKIVDEIADINKSAKGKYQITGIAQNINNQKGNIIVGQESRLLWGKEYFTSTIGKVSYKLSLASFSQINHYQAKRLNSVVEEMLNDEDGPILDAYTGIGNIALCLAKKRNKVIAVEEQKEAVENAIISAKENKIGNCSFIASTVEDYLETTRQNFQSVILNPPRKGCSEKVIKSLLEISPRKIIYVSCNPSTLARDLNKLCGDKYSIKNLIVIDMFPQTVHMETVVELELKTK